MNLIEEDAKNGNKKDNDDYTVKVPLGLGDYAVYFTNNALFAHNKGTKSKEKKNFKPIYYQLLWSVVTGI
jgi:hypothetical protein